MARPNQRTMTLGLTLLDHLAPAVTVALAHLASEYSMRDGLTAGTIIGGRRGGGDSSSTELAAMRAGRARGQADDIRAAIDAVEAATKHLATVVFGGLGMRVPDTDRREAPSVNGVTVVTLCKEGQHGRDASAWSDDLGCNAFADKSGLCLRHYQAWYRYRRSHNIDTTGDFEPAQ